MLWIEMFVIALKEIIRLSLGGNYDREKNWI